MTTCACRHAADVHQGFQSKLSCLACRCEKYRPLAPLPMRLGGWPCIYADPPWEEHGGGGRGAQNHYTTMAVNEIAAMGVPTIAAADAHLWLWVTNTFLPAGLKVMDIWGFRYISVATWAKDKIGLGYYMRGQTEQLLFGVKGRTLRQGQGRTLITAPRRKHSRKPDEARQMIETISPGPRLELFAREAAPGWSAWGNEAPDLAAPQSVVAP